MDNNCIFCKIISGDAPANIVYRDDLVVAFTPIDPVTDGHTLVIPVMHSENIVDTSETALHYVMTATKKIATDFMAQPDITGINLANNNGADAQQSVFHYHMHIIPRRSGDGLNFERERSL